jgi:hypothetical protein
LSRRSKTIKGHKRSYGKFVWFFSAAAIISALLYWNHLLLLYLLSTLAFCGLLLVVAFSDLESGDEELDAPACDDDSGSDSDVTSTVQSHVSVATLETEKC